MLLAAVGSVSLILTGCASAGDGDDTGTPDAVAEVAETTDAASGTEAADSTDSSDSDGSTDAAGSGAATARIDGVDFTFDLSVCSIGDEDTVAYGPGTSSTGEDAYLDIDFVFVDDNWEGEVRIDLGATTQSDSSDSFYLFTTHREDGDKLIGNIAMMSMFSATGTYWVDGGQDKVDGNVEVDCS